jgi:hypothetical protein
MKKSETKDIKLRDIIIILLLISVLSVSYLLSKNEDTTIDRAETAMDIAETLRDTKEGRCGSSPGRLFSRLIAGIIEHSEITRYIRMFNYLFLKSRVPELTLEKEDELKVYDPISKQTIIFPLKIINYNFQDTSNSVREAYLSGFTDRIQFCAGQVIGILNLYKKIKGYKTKLAINPSDTSLKEKISFLEGRLYRNIRRYFKYATWTESFTSLKDIQLDLEYKLSNSCD